MRVLKGLLVVCAVILGFVVCSGASAQQKHHKIVVAVTSGDEADWHLAAGNIRNLLTGFEKDGVEIEVVAFGPGINMVIKPSAADADIQGLIAKHVKFVACENSMRAHKVTAADLVTGVGSVPSGIVEVVSKQEDGWVYIKAGR